jgi:hypothetical protein
MTDRRAWLWKALEGRRAIGQVDGARLMKEKDLFEPKQVAEMSAAK